MESLLHLAQIFPSPLQILAELGRLLRNPNVEMADIALQLKRDPTLSARIIRLASSAAFTQIEPVAGDRNSGDGCRLSRSAPACRQRDARSIWR